MKYLSLILCFLGLSANAAAPTWVDQHARLVSVMPTLVLSTTLLEIKASPEDWAILSYEWKYSISDYQLELDQLKRQYPGFEIVRAKVVASQSNLDFIVQPLGLRVPTELKPEVEGAYMSGTLRLSKSQYQQLKSAKIAPSAMFALTGELTVEVTKAVVKERIALNAQVCERLLGPKSSTGDLVTNLARAVSQLERRPAGLGDADRDAWLKLVLEKCYSGPGLTWVRTLKDILSVELRLNSGEALADYVRLERSLVPERTSPTWIWRGSDENAN